MLQCFAQELLMIDDLLSALVGIEGRYTSIKRVSGIEGWNASPVCRFCCSSHVAFVRTCPVCYIPVTQAITRMPSISSPSPILRNLTYVHDENPVRTEPFGGSDFGGYPSLKQRNDSFDPLLLHIRFVRGIKPGIQSGFDIDDVDLLEMEQCQGIVVATAIFGNYDIIQQARNISEAAKKNVCFTVSICLWMKKHKHI
ncbi:hypothetical protein IFM89_038531 [Coptis chinensis]|uniref:TOD1/MUCI70 glycosyltransferase-like domain-containing protein n=1 Tax=Coptis chinensis TaxID=261450 RepID=A0A835M8K9_9MAGN|nr:hypothetical protein IFM89_038531 [Coptis chinensis]